MYNSQIIFARTSDGINIVRTEPAGKYFAEAPDGTRTLITLAQAVEHTMRPGSRRTGNRVGARMFDSALRKAQARG